MSKTAIIYSYNTQKSKKVAEKVIAAFGKNDIEVIGFNIKDGVDICDYGKLKHEERLPRYAHHA